LELGIGQPALSGDQRHAFGLSVRESHGQLEDRSARAASALRAMGLVPGDRVALLGRDSERSYVAILGAARAGLVSMGINWRLAPSEVRFVLEDAGARALLVDADRWPALAQACAELPVAERLVALDGELEQTPSFDSWLANAVPEAPAVAVGPDDVAVQMYTSGTTGRPKGVMLAHRSFFAVRRALREAGDPWIGWNPGDVSLVNIPSFHIGGLWWAMTGLGVGATNVVLPAFDPEHWLRAVSGERVTKSCMVPAMMQLVLESPALASANLSSLEWIVYGGSPIPRPLLARALESFGARLAQIYGLTETGNTAVCLPHEDHLDLDSERIEAAGLPYPTVRIEVVGPDGRPLPPRAVGEIRIWSPANMLGYWQRPEATAETLRDGWVHTGDAGFVDEDGRVYVRDRVKDMVIYAGENVYPAEIESVLCAFPGVREAAVIGVPDDRWGELPIAIVVREDGAEVRARALLAHARRELADFKVPKRIEWSAGLPRTPSGKIKKAELRAPFWEGRSRQVN
ncbi:MAG: long-chain-fatty-acid--CoA ligase, partial [Planctomycetota bacterium]